jgi:hypothetical protein
MKPNEIAAAMASERNIGRSYKQTSTYADEILTLPFPGRHKSEGQHGSRREPPQ